MVKAWRVEFEDAQGVDSMAYPPNLEKCRELIELFRKDGTDYLRASIYHNNKLEETWPLGGPWYCSSCKGDLRDNFELHMSEQHAT